MSDFTPTPPRPSDRADFYLTMSRAFRPPQDPVMADAMIRFLADDLDELAPALSLPVGAAVASLRQALADCGGHQPLLLAYSRLFLVPPVDVPLDASIYIDGAVLGQSTLKMEKCYHRHGVDKAEHVKDMPDNLSVQLEFAALLLGRAVEAAEAGDADKAAELERECAEWLAVFVAPWLPALATLAVDAEGRHGVVPVYGHLCRVLSEAVAAEVARSGVVDQKAPHEKKRGQARNDVPCTVCGEPFIHEAGLRRLQKVLDDEGLPSEHLQICPQCRDEAMGFERRSVPGTKRGGKKRSPSFGG